MAHTRECEKQVSRVYIVTIMTAKAFTAGVLLTIVPSGSNLEAGIGHSDGTT